MKNTYMYKNLKVIDLLIEKPKYSKKRLVFLLEDGTKVYAQSLPIKIKCKECNKWISIKFRRQLEDTNYICKSCKWSGEKNPFYGKKHSQELKDRLSKERKGIWGVGEKNSMYGEKLKDHMTPESYNKMLQKRKEHGYYSFSIEKQQQISNNMRIIQNKLKSEDPIKYHELRSKAGKKSVSKASNYHKTKPEIKVENYLIQHNVNYDYSCIMKLSENKCFQYDFIIHNKRILIEVQGDYWHGNPNLYNYDGSGGKIKLNEMQKQKIELDKIKEQVAIDHGFQIIYIWESEINNNDFSKLMSILK